MNPKPFVGLPAEGVDTATCSYAADLDQPGCGQDVTAHVIGWAQGWGWVALNTCGGHQRIAEAGCVYVADVHPADGCAGEHSAPAGAAGEQS